MRVLFDKGVDVENIVGARRVDGFAEEADQNERDGGHQERFPDARVAGGYGKEC